MEQVQSFQSNVLAHHYCDTRERTWWNPWFEVGPLNFHPRVHREEADPRQLKVPLRAMHGSQQALV